MRKLLATFAVAALVGLGACATDDEPDFIEEPVIEEPAPAPVITEPAPAMPDTMMIDTLAPIDSV